MFIDEEMAKELAAAGGPANPTKEFLRRAAMARARKEGVSTGNREVVGTQTPPFNPNPMPAGRLSSAMPAGRPSIAPAPPTRPPEPPTRPSAQQWDEMPHVSSGVPLSDATEPYPVSSGTPLDYGSTPDLASISRMLMALRQRQQPGTGINPRRMIAS